MRTAVLALVGITLVPQAAPPLRELLNAPRALTPDEIDVVLHAAQAAIAGKTLYLGAGPRRKGEGIEIVMAGAGRPQRIRVTGEVIEGTFSGIARDGTPTEPVKSTQRRVVKTFEMTGNGGPGISAIFEMLQGSVPLSSDEFEHRQIGQRQARALVAPWTPPITHGAPLPAMTIGEPAPNLAGSPPPALQRPVGTQRLWIDTSSRLPLRWEASDGAKDRRALEFVYARR